MQNKNISHFLTFKMQKQKTFYIIDIRNVKHFTFLTMKIFLSQKKTRKEHFFIFVRPHELGGDGN
jgi:hypothetical protein